MQNNIGWCDITKNPVVGCTMGCKWCWARRQAKRQKQRCQKCYDFVPHFHAERLLQITPGQKPRTIFIGSMCDMFDPGVDAHWLMEVYRRIRECPQHRFIILTKRPDRIAEMHRMLTFGATFRPGVSWDMEKNQPNLTIGVSVTNQEDADERIPQLLAAWKGPTLVSVEPIVGPVDLQMIDFDGATGLACLDGPSPDIQWVIAGGMTGPRAEPAHPGWFRTLRDQCSGAGVPFFFKQWGEWVPLEQRKGPFCQVTAYHRIPVDFNEPGRTKVSVALVGRKEAGHLLDGVEHRATPWDKEAD